MIKYDSSSLDWKAHLNDEQWNAIVSALPGNTGTRARHDRQHHYRSFVEAVLWVAANQAFWSELPHEYGSWRAIHIRFVRWCNAGIWPKVESALGASDDGELLGRLRAQHQQDQFRRSLWHARRTIKETDDLKLSEQRIVEVPAKLG